MDDDAATRETIRKPEPMPAEFASSYAQALRAHVEDRSDATLAAAAGLGRVALNGGWSMLQLVDAHLRIRRGLVAEVGVERLADTDAFLGEALTAFEVTQRDYVAARTAAEFARDRAEWLRALADSYLAISYEPDPDKRFAEICVQVTEFLGAADSRLELGRPGPRPPDAPAGDEIAVSLPGGVGTLTAVAKPGQRWTEEDRNSLRQLAVLIAGLVDDARRLDFARRSAALAALLEAAVDPTDIVERFVGGGLAHSGAQHAVVRVVGDLAIERSAGRCSPAVGALDDVLEADSPQFAASESGDVAWAVLPLSRGTTIGVVALGFDDDQPFCDLQRAFLDDVAQQLATALERSSSYARERAARQDAESVSARVRLLEELAVDLARASTRRRVAAVLLRRCLMSTSVQGALVVAYTDQPLVEVLAASGALAGDRGATLEHLAMALVTAPVVPPATDVDGQGSEVIDLAAVPGDIAHDLAAGGIHTLRRFPITLGPQHVGVLVAGWADDDAIDTDVDLLTAQVSIAGPTLQRAARYEVERSIADTLQRSILDVPQLPPIEGLDWAVHYEAAPVGFVGGDWYDVIDLGSDRVAIAVGDVVGHGIEAAAAMGQLRSAARALARRLRDPGALVTALDEFALHSEQGRYSSLIYAVLDVRTGGFSHVVAGHLPPLLMLPDGSVDLLRTGHGPLLGIEAERRGAMHWLPLGARVVLYTDGLVERRRESIDSGLERLVETAAELNRRATRPATCEELVNELLAQGPGADATRDDIAIVVVERR